MWEDFLFIIKYNEEKQIMKQDIKTKIKTYLFILKLNTFELFDWWIKI